MTEQLINEAPPDVRRAQRKSRGWGITAAALMLAVGLGVIYLVVSSGQQDNRISALAGVIDKQNNLYGQVCKLAGGQVNTDPAAREACARVERGEPAVPIPVVVTGVPGRDGDRGVGILYTRQIDRCFVEVVLTSGATSRFGSFCGADGPTGSPGPTGVSGEPGASGEPGQPGVTGARGTGVADVRTAANPCMVDVVLTDNTTRTIGPFCGPPMGAFTMTEENGQVKQCVRDGGSDTAPHYTCRPAATGTTETTATTTTAMPLIPTP
jgi:hypothetical protein